MKFLVTILLITTTFFSFAQRNKSDNQSYTEDLSKVHPKYVFDIDSLLESDTSLAAQKSVKPTFAENERLHLMLDSIFELNKEIKYIKGYTVLLYSGNSQEKALEVRNVVLELFEESEEFKGTLVEFKYHQPMFRIKVGEYVSRLEAVKVAEFLKTQKFDFGEESEIVINPLVVPDNIEIKRK